MVKTLSLIDAKTFFVEAISEAFSAQKLPSKPIVECYLSDLLGHFINTENLYHFVDESGKKRQKSLAELFLESTNLDSKGKQVQLKLLADLSLYMSGFFADSFKKKTVDIDYYAGMGVAAYGYLARSCQKNLFVEVYEDFSQNFMSYVEVISWVSKKSLKTKNEERLSIYGNYLDKEFEVLEGELLSSGMIELSQNKDSKPQ